jgi:hypothetical protein
MTLIWNHNPADNFKRISLLRYYTIVPSALRVARACMFVPVCATTKVAQTFLSVQQRQTEMSATPYVGISVSNVKLRLHYLRGF